MPSTSALEKLIRELKEKVKFYESIINKLPAIIYINEIDHEGDISTMKNIWSNKWARDFIGYRQEEITEMGYDFVKMILHPDDLSLTPQSLEVSKNNADDIFFSFMRQRPKNQEEYQWLYSRSIGFKSFPDGTPRQSLNIGFELHNELHSDTQLIILLKEINSLKYKLQLKLLTKRENEILKLITKGLTDKEIAVRLCISIATAKTHRNKIIRKLKLKNSATLAAFATECGL